MSARAVYHPSRFNLDVLEAMRPVLLGWGLPIHDPFAGTGERMAALAAGLDLTFSGTEIEAAFIVDCSVRPGDSTQADSYPPWEHCIATSPVYPNGMTDHFEAKDGTQRYTYRQALAKTVGHDQPLHGNNMGRYGPRGGRQAKVAYWALARMAVRHWPDKVLVNVKDCLIGGRIYRVAVQWATTLQAHGYAVTAQTVQVEGNRHGANRAARVDYETILIGERPARPTTPGGT